MGGREVGERKEMEGRGKERGREHLQITKEITNYF